MGLPAKRRTRRQKGDRNSHAARKPVATTTCTACGKTKQPHHACRYCGAYGRRGASTKTKKTARRRKAA